MPSPATSARLPQELIDSVVDELKHDVGSLRACSLVSKPWVYRSRRYLFATVHLPTCLLRKWLERVPADPNTRTPLDPHCHVRSLSLQPATTSAPFCIPETFVDHLSSFTQVSTLAIGSSLRKEWTDPFSDSALVAKYFGSLGQSLRKLELTRIHLNMPVLEALLDAFPRLEQILIFSPMMVNEEVKSVEALLHLRERRNNQGPSDVVRRRLCKKVSTRQVNNLTLLFPPRELVVGLIVSLPLRCQELVFAEDAGRSGDKLDLLLSSTGPTLESLVLRNTFDKGESFLPPFTPNRPSPFLTTTVINLTRFNNHARKLPGASEVEDESTAPVQRDAHVHRRSSQTHPNRHLSLPLPNSIPGQMGRRPARGQDQRLVGTREVGGCR